MSREFDIPKSHVIVAGTEYRLLGSTFAAGGQASLYEAVAQNSDVSRRFLIKRFHDSGDCSEEFESEELSQIAAANVHQAILAAAFYDKNQHASAMLKASSDCSTVQDILIAWEDIPPEDPASDYFDMGRFLESIQIAKSLLGALSGIHKHGVLHMDVSPSNVMWGRTEAHGTAYMLDFSCCAKKGSIVGERRRTTRSFSAPEAQIPGTVLTPAADIYSVGAVFLLLVAGMAAASNNRSEKKWSIRRLPGEGNTNVTDRVDDLDIPDAYKGKLSEIIIKATTSVEKRYQSASEMLADMVELERIIAGRGMTPETLIRGSASLFRKECDNENGIFHYELQDDLVTDVVDIDSKIPVDILTQNTILLGGGGSGKTTKIRTLWKKCLDKWKVDPKNNPIPIFVPLNTFDSKRSNWDFFIRDYITEAYFPGLSMDVSQRREDLIGMFESTGKYVLFLDGINEAVDSSMLNAEVAKLAAIKNVTVIITSRNDLGDGWSKTKELFSRAEMMPLSDGLIFKKLQEAELKTPSMRLLRTLHRPMFLSMYIRLKITDASVETSDQILHAHHNYLMQSCEAGHHGAHWERFVRFALNEILPRIASGMDRIHFAVDELEELLEAEHSTPAENAKLAQIKGYLEAQNQTITAKTVELYLHCGIIREIAENILAFTHQHYLDFYRTLEFARNFPEKPKPLVEHLAEAHVVRPYSYLELKQYYSAEEIACQITQNDSLLYPAELLKRHGGSPQLWAAHMRANPENWLFLCEEDTSKIVGNWSFLFISPEQEATVKAGRFAENQFLVTSRYDVTANSAEGCAVYLLNLSANDGCEDHRLVLWQTFIDRLLDIARKGVFLRGVYANALNDDNEGVFRSRGFVPLSHNIHGGKMFYLDLSSGFPKELSYFAPNADLEELYYQYWSKHLFFKQLAYDDVREMSDQQQKQIARLIWQTDPYIYPAMFSQDQAERLLPRIFAENSDNMFSMDNIFCAMIGNTVIGIILFHKGPLVWSASNVKRWSISVPPTIDIVEREYFSDYRKTPQNCISIINCCVDQKWRMRGIRIGSRMLEEFLKQHETETLDLYVLEESTVAVNLYLRYGFQMISMCNGFSLEGKDLPCYYMQKNPKTAKAVVQLNTSMHELAEFSRQMDTLVKELEETQDKLEQAENGNNSIWTLIYSTQFEAKLSVLQQLKEEAQEKRMQADSLLKSTVDTGTSTPIDNKADAAGNSLYMDQELLRLREWMAASKETIKYIESQLDEAICKYMADELDEDGVDLSEIISELPKNRETAIALLRLTESFDGVWELYEELYLTYIDFLTEDEIKVLNNRTKQVWDPEVWSQWGV